MKDQSWIDIKNTKLQTIIDNCSMMLNELDLSNPDKRTKNWKEKRRLEVTIKHHQQSIEINNSKRK